MKIFETGMMAGIILWIICFICFAISQVGAMAKRSEHQGWTEVKKH